MSNTTKVYLTLKELVDTDRYHEPIAISGRVVQFRGPDCARDHFTIIDGLTGEVLTILEPNGELREVFDQDWCFGPTVFSEKITETYAIYHKEHDISIIFRDEWSSRGYTISKEVVGFYHGEPDPDATRRFTGKLRAEY